MEVAAHIPTVPEQVSDMIAQQRSPIAVGCTYMDNEGILYRVTGFEYSESYSDGYKERVLLEYRKGNKWTKWDSGHLCTVIDDIEKCRWVPVQESDIEKFRQEAVKVLNGEISTNEYTQHGLGEMSEERAVMAKSSKESLLAMEKTINEKRVYVATVQKFMNLEIEKRKNDLLKISQRLEGAVAVFYKQIQQLMRVITTIELYLGVGEELHQIMQGENAPKETPITFRQQVLFIDEEVGVYEDGGLDSSDITKFDEWLVTDSNYKLIIPEEKGMVVLRPRRYTKKHNGDYDMEKMKKDIQNTYFLIRNGGNLYRIFTEKLIVMDRLFPKRTELMELYEELQKSYWEGDKEKIEKDMYGYKKRALFMQGLIDRTEVFYPLPADKINIFKLDEIQDCVNFIYDDEALLPTGRLSFSKWKEQINASISHGSRVLLTGYGRPADYESRYFKFYRSTYTMPATPKQGIYEVEVYKEEKSEYVSKDKYGAMQGKELELQLVKVDEKYFSRINGFEAGYLIKYIKPYFTVMYQAGGETWGGWGKGNTERKNRVRFRIEPQRDDEVLNYDQIDLADIEFYLHSRVDRPNYLWMMPVLKKIRKFRIEEMKGEKAFARLVFDRNVGKVAGIDDSSLEQRINECIDWWKYKNQWKRPIDKDDELALRMIERRINSKNYSKLKKESNEQ